MKVHKLIAVTWLLTGCGAATETPRAHAQSAGGSSGAPASPEPAGSGGAADAGASGAPEEAQAGAAGAQAGQQSDGGSAGDATPTTQEAGAGGEAGLPESGPAPGALWGHCTSAPDAPLLCDDPAHTCWKWLDPADLAVKEICAPTYDSVHTLPGSTQVVYGLDLALKQQCEAMGGECGRYGPDWQDACYPPRAD